VTEFVDGDAILAQARGSSTPSEADTAWAAMCADAVNEAMTIDLKTYAVVADSDAEKALQRAALLDGVAAYADRDAPTGILSLGPDGQPVRVRADVLRAAVPVIDRLVYPLPGIG
jgi:hypothetical protein